MNQNESFKEFKEIYYQIFNKVKDRISNDRTGKQRRGVLYEVIKIIFEQDEVIAKEICKYFCIKPYTLIGDDIKNFDRQVINIKILRNKNYSIQKEEDMELLGIVFIAVSLVGTFSIIKRRNNDNKNIIPGKEKTNYIAGITPVTSTDKSQTMQQIAVALCLIVQASLVENLEKNQVINTSQIEEIIAKSLYFLCTNISDADTIWEILDKTDEDVKSLSEQREVYIRIDIPNGQEMIGKKYLHSLKRNLPSHGECIIKQLACLKYLSVSGLEKFNRV
jgi:hypothetical protein